MSSTAGVTIPGQRPVYMTKVQISSRDKNQKNKTKKNTVKSGRKGSSKSKGSGEEIHRSWGKSKEFAYVFTGTGDAKPWSKLQSAPPQKPRTYKAKAKPADTKDEGHHVYKIKEDGKRKVQKGTLVVSDKYFEAVKDERTRLLDLLESLQKRNNVLERENADMVKNFQALNRENEQLRKKLDTGGEPVIESYKRVYDDRTLLREAENSYKKRLHKLEEELRISQRNYDRVNDELKLLKERLSSKMDDVSNKAKYNRFYWDCYHLRAENEFLKESVKTLRLKIESMSKIPQKGPHTAPVETVKPPDRQVHIPPKRQVQVPPTAKPETIPTETFGQHVRYITLPEIEERRHDEKMYGI